MKHQTRLPSYRLHKASGQAIVAIRGRMFYLGRYGSDESRAEYKRIVAEWLAISPEAPPPKTLKPGQHDLRICELINAYRGHVESYYVKHGQQTSEVDTIRQALPPVERALWAHTSPQIRTVGFEGVPGRHDRPRMGAKPHQPAD